MIYCFISFENKRINKFKKIYTYGKNNEVKEIFDNKQRLSVKLDYDKNGREVLRKFGNGTVGTTLYDGLSFEVIKHSPTFANGMFTDSSNTGIQWGKTGKPTGTHYDENPDKYLKKTYDDGKSYIYFRDSIDY